MLSLRGVISAFLQIYGGVGLDHIGCHARPPAKPHESGVYDSGGVGYLSCIRGSRVPSSGEGGGGMSLRAQSSMSKDSVRHHTNFSALYCNCMA
jgi:hypothetical protein